MIVSSLKQYLFLFILSLLSSFGIKAQTLRVYDSESKQPLEMVSFISESTKVFATSNARGQVDLSGFEGEEKIEVRLLGYKTQYLSFAELEALDFKLVMVSYNLSLSEVVVSATGWRQTSNEVPQKIISISTREVAFQNPQTAADLLGISGKVYIQKSQQGGGSPMIRGFATNRLLYTVDGVRMNTAIFRSGNIQNVISLDPFATENTEVLFGAGSVKYGSDAIGGVMSFKTLTPQLSLEDEPLVKGKAVLRYASANQEKTGHFDINLGWKKWALVTSFSTWDYDHLRQGSNGPDDYLKPVHVENLDSTDKVVSQDDELLQIPTAYSQVNFMQKLRFKPNKDWDFQYGIHYSQTSQYGRYDRHNRMNNGLPRYGEWDYGPQKWLMNNLNISHSSVNPFYDKATLILAYQSFEESRITRDLNDPERTTRTEEVDAYSLNFDLVKTTSSRNALFYGVEYVLNNVESQGQLDNIITGQRMSAASRYPQSTWSSAAIYVNEEFDWTEKLTLQAGARYNLYSIDAEFDNQFYPFPFSSAEVRNDALTGSLGAIYRPSPDWIFNLNFGTAFRSPNVDDIGKVFDSEPGRVVVPNPNLEAEYAYNFDIGIAKVIKEFVKVDVAMYYTILNNAMVRRNFQLDGLDSIMYDGSLSQVQAIQNAAQASVYGVQLGLEVQLPYNFQFSSDLNFQEGEEELDNGSVSPSRHAAPIFGISRLTYRNKGLQLQLYSEYQGERSFTDLAVEEQSKDEIYAKDKRGNNYAPAWYTLSFKAMYQFNSTFTLTAGIENITDQRYRPYGSGLSGPGRNLITALSLRF